MIVATCTRNNDINILNHIDLIETHTPAQGGNFNIYSI